MANTISILKILDYLKTKKEVAVAPSKNCSDIMLKYRTVKEVLDILKMNNQIVILASCYGLLVVGDMLHYERQHP